MEVFISAGEVSGDLHGAHLMRAMRSYGAFTFVGLGGEAMLAEGLEAIHGDVALTSSVGFTEALRYTLQKMRLFAQARRYVRQHRIRFAILIDNQGFSIPLGQALKALGVHTVFYIAPSVSMWGAWNAAKLPRFFDVLCCFGAKDAEMYRQHGGNAWYFGNPVQDLLDGDFDMDDFYAAYDLDPNRPVVGLLPGSRVHEVRRLLPIMARAAKHIPHSIQWVLPIAHTGLAPVVRKILQAEGMEHQVICIAKDAKRVMRASLFCVMAAGTASLEAVLLGTFPIVMYKGSWLSYWLARMLTKGPFRMALPNIFLGDAVFPEYLQSRARGDLLQQAVEQAYLGAFPGQQNFASTREALLQELGVSHHVTEQHAEALAKQFLAWDAAWDG